MQDDEGDYFGSIPLVRLSPSYDVGLRILARDPLGSVVGFRSLMLLAYKFLFGMRVCPYCPDCNNCVSSTPCQDLFGSNATPAGGVFGRVDAIYNIDRGAEIEGQLARS